MVLFLADSSGQLADRNSNFVQNWTFFTVTLIQVLHHQVRVEEVKAFDELDDAGEGGLKIWENLMMQYLNSP